MAYLVRIAFPSAGHPYPIRGCAIPSSASRDTNKVLIDYLVLPANLTHDAFKTITLRRCIQFFWSATSVNLYRLLKLQ